MTAAYEYARALFMLSEEERTTEKVYADLCVERVSANLCNGM